MENILILIAATMILVAIPGPNVALIVAAANPKTLLFNAAFLPQFMGPGASTLHFGFIAVVFLAVLMLGDLLWALFANAARPFLHKAAGLRKRVTGAFLVLAGIGLAWSRRV